MRRLLLVTLMVFGSLCGTAIAEVPGRMNLQGRLVDSTGTPLDTNVEMTFRLYDDKFGTTLIWQEVQPNVRVNNGRFDVRLGKVVPLTPAVLDGTVRYLSVQVGSGEESNASIEIVSSAYAQRASHADTALVALNAVSNGWVDLGTVIHPQTLTDRVGIGTDDPLFPLDVVSSFISITGRTEGGNFLCAGVYGHSDSLGAGVLGQSSDGHGVHGSSTNAFAGYFEGPKNYFSGRVGIGTTNPQRILDARGDSTVIYGRTSGSGTSAGVMGVSTGTGTGVSGSSSSGYGGRFDGGLGIGVFGTSSGLSATHFICSSGTAVYGTSTTGYGGYFDGGTGIGVYGESDGSLAAYFTSNSGTAVYGTSTTGYGGYFMGPKHYFNGLLGLATTSPTHRLTVNGAIGLQTGGETKFHINYYNNGFNVSETTVADYRLYVKEGGNVGVGTSAPAAKLHVAGDAVIDGELTANAIYSTSIADEAGIASSGIRAATALNTDWTTMRTRTFTTPADGYVLAIASATVNILYSSGEASAELGLEVTADSIPYNHRYELEIPAGSTAGMHKHPCATQRVFDLSAGTYTFRFLGRKTGTNPVGFHTVKLALLFVPTEYDLVPAAQVDAAEHDAASSLLATEPVDRQEVFDPEHADLHRVSAELAALREEVAALKNQVASQP